MVETLRVLAGVKRSTKDVTALTELGRATHPSSALDSAYPYRGCRAPLDNSEGPIKQKLYLTMRKHRFVCQRKSVDEDTGKHWLGRIDGDDLLWENLGQTERFPLKGASLLFSPAPISLAPPRWVLSPSTAIFRARARLPGPFFSVSPCLHASAVKK